MPATNKKSIFSYGWYIAVAMNVVVIMLLFMSVLSWYIPPTITTLFAYLGLGFPFILIANFCFVVLWLVFRKWKFLVFAIIPILILIIPILTYFPLNLKKKEVPEGCIKFLSYNVRAFNWHTDKDGEENEIIRYVRESEADIVCIQEYVSLDKNPRATTDKIRKRVKKYPYFTYINLRPKLKIYNYGVACFSKYPIVSATEIPYQSDNGSVCFKINVDGKMLYVVGNHLESNGLTSEDKKMYRKFFEESSQVKIDDIAHNIKDRLGSAYRKRVLQATTVSEYVKELGDKNIIVCGDFNDTPISYTYHKMRGNLMDSYLENGFGPGITYHENKFWFRIDYILHSSNITSYNFTIDKVKYSDHYPVWTYLKID